MTLKNKSYLTILLYFFFSSNLVGQIDFVDRLYGSVMFEDLELIGADGKVISKEEIFDLFYQIDTATNCFGGIKAEFIENQYISNGLLIIRTENEIDTSRSSQIESKVDFNLTLKDDNGEKYGTKKIFSLNQKAIKKIENSIDYDSSNNEKRLITKKEEFWAVEGILIGKEKVFIDECHKKYELRFFSKENFTQTYRGEINCQAKVDKDSINELGYLKYWGNETEHSTVFNVGKWKTEGNMLYFVNKKEDQFKIMSYAFENDVLILKPTLNYRILLRKKSDLRKK